MLPCSCFSSGFGERGTGRFDGHMLVDGGFILLVRIIEITGNAGPVRYHHHIKGSLQGGAQVGSGGGYLSVSPIALSGAVVVVHVPLQDVLMNHVLGCLRPSVGVPLGNGLTVVARFRIYKELSGSRATILDE